jgi:polyhydroxyalkanoate synthesis regulator phasin
MANGELRALRDKAHKQFDKLHTKGLMSKDDAYRWLAGILQAPQSEAHIGHLNDYYCKKVIEESKKVLDRYQARGIS